MTPGRWRTTAALVLLLAAGAAGPAPAPARTAAPAGATAGTAVTAQDARALVAAAIRLRQDLNGGRTTGGDADAVDELDAVARDAPASAAVLGDPELRPALLGLNWAQAAPSVAALVAAGTAPGGPHAPAALAVMREVAGDAQGYRQRMAPAVARAVAGVGAAHVSALEADPSDPDGAPGVLAAGERDRYLQFVAGLGERAAVDALVAIRAATRGEVSAALVAGDPARLGRAVTTAGTVAGAGVQAAFAARAEVLVLAESRAARAVEHALAVEDLVHQGVRATVPRPATLGELRRETSEVTAVYRDLFLVEAADAAGRVPPADRPRLLDREPGSSLFGSSVDQAEILGAPVRVYDAAGVPDAPRRYAAARARTLTGRLVPPPAPDSAWVRDPDRLRSGD